MKISEIMHAVSYWRHPGYHRDIIKHVRWTDTDQRRMDFYGAFIDAGNLVFDIGANMGNRSKIFIRLGARVIAFEPQSYCADFLSFAFADTTGFKLDRRGLSDRQGSHTMHLGKAHTLATIDPDWIARMRDGGRFSGHDWNKTETINLVTLDDAIDIYGEPSFAKIDVEGHEHSVVRGLTRPIAMLSLEFASESLENIYQCIDHLETLDNYQYRISLAETMSFSGDAWRSAAEIRSDLEDSMRLDPLVWGDLYARRAT
jgi:FkbM family methyltransferase